MTYAGGEDRPCGACNADFYERSSVVVSPERLEQEAAHVEVDDVSAAGWLRAAARRIAELEVLCEEGDRLALMCSVEGEAPSREVGEAGPAVDQAAETPLATSPSTVSGGSHG